MDQETCEDCGDCGDAICRALDGFTAPGLVVKDCKTVVRENSHGQESVFAEVQLMPPEGDTWPLESVNLMRDAIYSAALNENCELPIYLTLLPAEDLVETPA